MSLQTDLLLDRRRLKRRLVFWRFITVLALVVASLVAIGKSGVGFQATHVARVSVTGLMTEDGKLVKAVDALADDGNVKAVLLCVDSPGGSVAAGEALHDAIERVATQKPVVTVMGATAASAGYMIAVPTQRIFARESTLTGSIGVLLEAPEFSGLLGKIGVNAEVIRSGPLKDEPSLVRPLSGIGREVMQALVNDMYAQFVAIVAKGRNLPIEKVRELADGRPYTGRQALNLGLIDQIGGEREARAWMAAEKSVPVTLPTEDVSTASVASRAFSGQIGGFLFEVWKTVLSQSVSLDGAWAVWHRSNI